MILVFFLALIVLQSAASSSHEFLLEKPLPFNSRNLENATSVNSTNSTSADITNSTSMNSTNSTSVNITNSTSVNTTDSTSSNSTNNTNTTNDMPGNPLRFILYYASLYGQWSNDQKESQGTLFVEDVGYAIIETSSDETDSETDITDTDTDWTDSTDTDVSDETSDSDLPDYTKDDFYLTIYDGKATNRNSIILSMNFENMTYDETNSSFIGTQEISYVFSGNNKNISGCLANISIFYINISDNTPLISRPHVELHNTGVQLQIASPQCSIALTTTVMTVTSFADSALPVYIGLMSLAGLIGAFSAYQMLKNFPDNVEELKSMSVWGLWITSAWELFLAIFHIYIAVKYFSFWVLVVSFIFFFTISMLRKINQLILIVSRVERGDNLPLNSRMMMALIPMVILCVSYCFGAFDPSVSFLLLTGGVYMVPQIYRIWKRGERPSGYYWHNFAYAFSKTFFVAYYLLYPYNLFGNYPNLEIGYTFVGLIIAQILIVLAQRHVPQLIFTFRMFMHKQREQNADRTEECSICYELLVQESVINGDEYDQIVETPCHHRFHRRCIEEWVNLRGTCPLDRKKINLGDLMF